MMDKKIICYAINFLNEEIRQIKELLKQKATSKNDKKILNELLKQYEKDLQELEGEN